MISRLAVAALAATLGLGLAACGESEQTTERRYQGKLDAKPYDNAGFSNDREQWEGAIRTRGMYQNEYRRMGG